MKITVIGCGRWGSFIAWYLDKTGHNVSLYGREGSPHMKQVRESRTNGIVTLPQSGVAVWLGPGHVQEFVAGIPNCMVIDGTSEELKERLVTQFSSSLIRFYYGRDLIGNEVGAAAKNVIGIAAGILDGMGLTNLKGALMARGTREVARLIVAMGGIEHSAYGLCHLGDYQATVFSQFSHNRAFGEAFAKGEKFGKLAEGYYTVEALMELSKKYGVDMPISRAVHKVLYDGANPRDELTALFMRSLKKEF